MESNELLFLELIDLEILRSFFLDNKIEAFRERASRLPTDFFKKNTNTRSIELIYRALILKSEDEEDKQAKELENISANALEILQRNDITSEVLSEIGLVFIMIGEMSEAQEVLTRAIEFQPVSAYAYFRLGTLYAITDELDDALLNLQKGLDLVPQRAEAWANIGHVYMQRAEAKKARDAFVKGWELRPANRGLALKAIDALNEADELASYKINLKSEIDSTLIENKHNLKFAGCLAQLALLAEKEGNTQEMIFLINEALKFSEEYEEIRRLYTDMMLDEERYWILGQQLKAWTEKFDVFSEHMALARCRIGAGYIETAKDGLAAIEERSFGDPEWDNRWAECLMEEGNYEEAKNILEKVHNSHSEHLPTINLLADVCSSLGEIDRSMELTQKAADHAPGPLLRLIENKKEPNQEDISRLEDWLTRIDDDQLKTNIYFTLSHVFDRMKKYEEASNSIKKANDGIWESLHYKPQDFTKQVDELIENFDRRWIDAHRVEEIFDVRPIFIVGMPRSGTTMLEQMFAAHPQVYGGGELPLMGRIRNLSEKITKRNYPHSMLSANRTLLKDAAQYYLEEAKRTLNFNQPIVVDKLPHNFLDAALICALFPNARIISLRRDYRAIALSNYFQNFSAKKGALGYAFNLEAMGHHLKDFHRLMDYWSKTLPPKQYQEFHYEKLVENPTDEIPKVMAFCGLEFTAEIMEFYRNKTAIRTASVRQVRNPVYTASVEKWRNYEELLIPLIKIVEESVHE